MDRAKFQEKLNAMQKLRDRCFDITNRLRRQLDGHRQQHPMIELWRNDLKKIESKLEFPRTVVAVVGDTGGGKSSLINALLDQKAILPTAGLGHSCTAVVIEVTGNTNTTSHKFEADIEFLTEQEWYGEVQALLEDLEDIPSHERIRRKLEEPLKSTYDKLIAAYGEIQSLEILKGKPRGRKIGKCLIRKVDYIRESDPNKFKDQLIKYIEPQEIDDEEKDDDEEKNTGIQFWPIVKKVKVRIQDWDVCKSGAVLVDLPGVRDSSAAKSKLSREYLKDCNSLWIVLQIQRAIDSETADDFLNRETLREQYMDGKYAGIVFVCTKADDLQVEEIERKLEKKMPSNHQNLIKEIKRLEQEKKKLKEIKMLVEKRNQLKEKAADGESQHKDRKELKKEFDDVEKKVKGIHTDPAQKIFGLELKIMEMQKRRKEECALARNAYCADRIRKKFAEAMSNDIVGEDFQNESSSDSEQSNNYLDDSEEASEKPLKETKVFCCSATEYMAYQEDDYSSVFSSAENTQIPMLQDFVTNITFTRQVECLTKALQHLMTFLQEGTLYLSENNPRVSKDGYEDNINKLFSKLERIQALRAGYFSERVTEIMNSVDRKLSEGVRRCEDLAVSTSKKWGLPCAKNKKTRDSASGLHHKTYIAAVKVERSGVYVVPRQGTHVNLNYDLARPLFDKSGSFSKTWKVCFSEQLPKEFENLKKNILNDWKGVLEKTFQESGLDGPTEEKFVLNRYDMDSVTLSDVVDEMTKCAKEHQYGDYDLFQGSIQNDLRDVYVECNNTRSNRKLEHIKKCMENGIEKKKNEIFKTAAMNVKAQLTKMKIRLSDCATSGLVIMESGLKKCIDSLTTPHVEVPLLFSEFEQARKEAQEIQSDLSLCTGPVSDNNSGLRDRSDDTVEINAFQQTIPQPSTSGIYPRRSNTELHNKMAGSSQHECESKEDDEDAELDFLRTHPAVTPRKLPAKRPATGGAEHSPSKFSKHASN